ncbi:MFS transporter small subunit [Streptomyces monomycini]
MTARRTALLVLAWLWVGLPFGYGLYELALKLRQLFTG